MNEKLGRFIDHARQKGMDHATVLLLLHSAGWKDKEIAKALAARELEMAIPERAGIGSARDAFFHLLAFTALYAWAVSLIYLLFAYIEFALPDPAARVTSFEIKMALSAIRVCLATLIVSFPLFLVAWWYLLREVRISPELAKSGVRRWLSFLSLFVGAVTILADVITAVYYFVEGDLTVRFLLKVAALFVVTGALIPLPGAYIAIGSGGWQMSPRIHVAFAVFASIVVVGTVVWGFVLVGSPSTRRLERFDQRRLDDLQAIAREIRLTVLDPTNEAVIKKPIPRTLKEAAERAQRASQSARSRDGRALWIRGQE